MARGYPACIALANWPGRPDDLGGVEGSKLHPIRHLVHTLLKHRWTRHHLEPCSARVGELGIEGAGMKLYAPCPSIHTVGHNRVEADKAHPGPTVKSSHQTQSGSGYTHQAYPDQPREGQAHVPHKCEESPCKRWLDAELQADSTGSH